MQSLDIPLDPKVALTHTPSDGNVGKFTWILFSVRPRPLFFPFFSLFLSHFCHLVSHLISLSGRLG